MGGSPFPPSLGHGAVLVALGVLLAVAAGRARRRAQPGQRAFIVGGGLLLGVLGVPITDLIVLVIGFAATAGAFPH